MKNVKNSVFNYYKKLSSPVKASFWFTVSSIIRKGISLLSTPIFTRLLTTEQYGVYSVYQSWYAIIAIFATLNLYAGVYNNGMTKWPDERPQYTSALLGLSTTCTVVLFLVYLAAHDFWNQLFGLSGIFVVLIFLQVLFESAYSFWAAGERYDYRYKKLVIVTIIMGVASPVLGIAVVWFSEYKAEARVFSYVFVQVCVGVLLYIRNMVKGKKFYVKEYWKFALSFNLPLIPHYLSQTVLNQADRIMISNMAGSGEAAIYSIAYTISMMFTIVTGAINNTFIPYTYKAIRDQRYAELRRNSSFLVLFVGVACIVAMAFGPELIRVFAAPEYYEARWVVPPVAEALLFMFIYPLFCNVEFYYEQTKFIMVASSIAALINIGLNYIGITYFGYVAAAYTTLICYVLLSVAHYLAYKKICKKEGIDSDIYNIRFFVKVSLVSILVMVLMTMVYDIAIIRYLVVGIIITICYSKRDMVQKKINEILKG